MSSSTEQRIPVGLVGRPHGVRGEVTVVALTDHPERFRAGASFGVDGDPGRMLVIDAVRSHHGRLLVAFAGVADRDAAESLRGVTLTIGADERRPLEEGEFWPEQLSGMAALDPNGTRLGIVTGVILADAQDRIVVTTPDGRQVEIPFVDALVSDVHPSGGFLVIKAPEGLF